MYLLRAAELVDGHYFRVHSLWRATDFLSLRFFASVSYFVARCRIFEYAFFRFSSVFLWRAAESLSIYAFFRFCFVFCGALQNLGVCVFSLLLRVLWHAADFFEHTFFRFCFMFCGALQNLRMCGF